MEAVETTAEATVIAAKSATRRRGADNKESAAIKCDNVVLRTDQSRQSTPDGELEARWRRRAMIVVAAEAAEALVEVVAQCIGADKKEAAASK